MTRVKENISLNELIKKGWNILVENLGIADATRFIVIFERGEGDSIREIKKFWGDKKIEEIHEEVLDAKKKKLL